MAPAKVNTQLQSLVSLSADLELSSLGFNMSQDPAFRVLLSVLRLLSLTLEAPYHV